MAEWFSYVTSVPTYTSITNPNNVFGAPDDTPATCTSSSAQITMNLANPDYTIQTTPDAVIQRWTIGARLKTTDITLRPTMALLGTGVDTTVKTWVPAAADTYFDVEFDMNVATCNPAALKAAYVQMVIKKVGAAGTLSIDAAWVRVTYTNPPGIKHFGSNVASSTNFTTPTNALGVPDRVTGDATTIGAVITIDVPAFTEIPAGATMLGVWAGMTYQVNSLTVGSTARVLSAAGAASITHTKAANTATSYDMEWELDLAVHTSAVLRQSLQIEITKTASSSALRIDSVWIRAIYTMRPTAEVRGYVASATGWTNPANAVGAPNVTYATTSGITNLVATMAALTDLPTDAELLRVSVGIRSIESAQNVMQAQLSAGDTVARNVTKTGGPDDYEWVLDAWRFTPTQLRSGTLTVSVKQLNSSTSTASLDAVWLEAVYATGPEPSATRAKRWDGSAWVDAPVKRWDGSAWVDATVKRFDGSGWV